LLLLAAALAFSIWAALNINTLPPEGDAKIYSRMAVNVDDYRVISPDDQPDLSGQFKPSIIRLPGYPVFLASVYSIAGDENYTAVRVVQAVLHFLAAILASLLAYYWAGGSQRRRRKAAFWTFVLTALCPFSLNYSSVLLTEVLTIFLMMAMTLMATYAIRSRKLSNSLILWAVTGFLAGAAVEVRPDSGLLALALGLTLVVAAFRDGPKRQLISMLEKGSVLTMAFVIALTPWTIRNEREFGIFQPLAPQHAEAPGEFVPLGYFHWLRTWIDDSKYISPMLWELEIHRIDVNKIPASAFTSGDEKARVLALFDQYNDSDPDHPLVPKPVDSDADDSGNGSADSANSGDDDADSEDRDDDQDQADQELDLKISPESDAAFEQIAQERMANQPFMYYVELPAQRAVTMWFDTHSDFYPFAGVLFPLQDIDSTVHQDIWLPLCVAGVWLYTLLAFAGVVILLIGRWPRARVWALMALLITIPRIAYFATLENPEPRYLVELFFIAAILGGIALSTVRFSFGRGSINLKLSYGRN